VVVLNVGTLDLSFVTKILPFNILTKGKAVHFLSSAVYVPLGPMLYVAESCVWVLLIITLKFS